MDDIFKGKEKVVRIRRSFNISVELSKKVDDVSFKKGFLKSEVVEKALIYYFEELEKQSKKKK